MKKENKKTNDKTIIIGIIIAVLIIIICYLLYLFKLDDRECLDCPYVEKLHADDIIISSDNGNSFNKYRLVYCINNENAFCYIGEVSVKTLSSNLKATGRITIKYDCDYQTYYWTVNGKQYKNNNLKGRYSFDVEEMTSENVYFDIIRQDGSSIETINCYYDIENAQGNLYIYGDRVR